jgi:hypothetical protein
MDPLNPNGISFKINIPDLFSKKTVITSSDVKKTQSTFIFRKTNRAPSNQYRFVPRDSTSPQEIAVEKDDLLDNSIKNRKNIQLELNHAI